MALQFPWRALFRNPQVRTETSSTQINIVERADCESFQPLPKSPASSASPPRPRSKRRPGPSGRDVPLPLDALRSWRSCGERSSHTRSELLATGVMKRQAERLQKVKCSLHPACNFTPSHWTSICCTFSGALRRAFHNRLEANGTAWTEHLSQSTEASSAELLSLAQSTVQQLS